VERVGLAEFALPAGMLGAAHVLALGLAEGVTLAGGEWDGHRSCQFVSCKCRRCYRTPPVPKSAKVSNRNDLGLDLWFVLFLKCSIEKT
jgi:hypothetical protein